MPDEVLTIREVAPKSAGAPPNKNNNGSAQSDALVGFEAKLWWMADRFRSNMDAVEYKQVVLGLIWPRQEAADLVRSATVSKTEIVQAKANELGELRGGESEQAARRAA